MAKKTEKKDFAKADEVRVFPKGKVELITIGGATIGRAILEPGGAGQPPYSRSRKRRAAKRPISSITQQGP